MFRAIGFDFDHTLGIDNKLERTVSVALIEEMAAAAGLRLEPGRAPAEAEHTLLIYRGGTATFDVAWGAFAEKLLGPGTDGEEFVQQFRERAVEAVPSHVQILPQVREVLAELTRRGIPYAILTNGWSPLQEAKAEAIDFEGTVLVSDRIGQRKPQPGAFAALEHALGQVPRNEIAYVGDDPLVDVAAAQSAGFTGVWFDWEGRGYPETAPSPNHVIHEFGELLALIQGPVG